MAENRGPWIAALIVAVAFVAGSAIVAGALSRGSTEIRAGLDEVKSAMADTKAALLARAAVHAVFAEREALAHLVLRDSSRAPVTRAAAVSGALVRAACESAQKLAFVRHARAGGRGRPRGILRGDLLAALDEQFGRVVEHLSVENVGATVTIPPEAAGNVVAVEVRRPSQHHRYLVDPDPPRRRSQPVAAS